MYRETSTDREQFLRILHEIITLEERITAYRECPIQIWIHRPASPLKSRHAQSGMVRQLLKLALAATNISVTESTLALPGIKLIQSVREQSGVGISITHCPEMLAVAIGTGKLGLDCEALGKKRNWQGIAEQFFTTSEADAIRHVSYEMTERAFLQHWTLKEAFVKATQKSIFGGLNQLIVCSSKQVQLQGVRQGQWQVYHAAVGKCVLAVCCQDDRAALPVLLECTDLSSGTLVNCQEANPMEYMSILYT